MRGAGASFAFVKVSEGVGYTSPYFAADAAAARARASTSAATTSPGRGITGGVDASYFHAGGAELAALANDAPPPP